MYMSLGFKRLKLVTHRRERSASWLGSFTAGEKKNWNRSVREKDNVREIISSNVSSRDDRNNEISAQCQKASSILLAHQSGYLIVTPSSPSKCSSTSLTCGPTHTANTQLPISFTLHYVASQVATSSQIIRLRKCG